MKSLLWKNFKKRSTINTVKEKRYSKENKFVWGWTQPGYGRRDGLQGLKMDCFSHHRLENTGPNIKKNATFVEYRSMHWQKSVCVCVCVCVRAYIACVARERPMQVALGRDDIP